jgi:hypothetical protein
VAGAKIQRCIYAISIGLTINQGSNAVLKAEGFASVMILKLKNS